VFGFRQRATSANEKPSMKSDHNRGAADAECWPSRIRRGMPWPDTPRFAAMRPHR
jgi:hypothetical protein